MSLKKTVLNGLTILSLTLLASTAGWSSGQPQVVEENGASASKAKLTTTMEQQREKLRAEKEMQAGTDLLSTGSKAAAATAKKKKEEAEAEPKKQVREKLVQTRSIVAVMDRIAEASGRDHQVLASLTACGYAPSRDELVAQAVGMLQERPVSFQSIVTQLTGILCDKDNLRKSFEMMSKENTMRSMQFLIGQEVEKAAEQNRQLSYACMGAIGAGRANFQNAFALLQTQHPEFLQQRLVDLEAQMKDMSELDKAQAAAEMQDINGRLEYIEKNQAEVDERLKPLNVSVAMAAAALYKNVRQVRMHKDMLEEIGIVPDYEQNSILIGGRRCQILEGERGMVIILDGKEIFKGEISPQERRQHGYVRIEKEMERQQAPFGSYSQYQGDTMGRFCDLGLRTTAEPVEQMPSRTEDLPERPITRNSRDPVGETKEALPIAPKPEDAGSRLTAIASTASVAATDDGK